MNSTLKMILSLSVISLFSGGVLELWEGHTLPLVEHHAAERIKRAVAKVLPEHDSTEEKIAGDIRLHIARKTGQEDPVGIAVYGEGNGFQGTIGIMIGMNGTMTEITGIQVLKQLETPGLGDKIVKDPSNRDNPYWFPDQFKGVSAQSPITVLKNKKPSGNTEIQAITGATISSKAVTAIVSKYTNKARESAPEFLKTDNTEESGKPKQTETKN